MSDHITILTRGSNPQRAGGAPISPAVRVGATIYTAGQGPTDPDGRLVGAGDLSAQAERCFQNIADILTGAGGSMQDVVKMTTYFTGPLTREVAEEYWAVRTRFFGTHKPASTGVQVVALVDPEWLLEIEAIAVLSAAPPSD